MREKVEVDPEVAVAGLDPDPLQPNKSYCSSGSVLEDLINRYVMTMLYTKPTMLQFTASLNRLPGAHLIPQPLNHLRQGKMGEMSGRHC